MENKNVVLQADQLLKAVDIASILNISRSLVYQLIRSGEIPVIRIKSMVRIKSSDLELFIENSRSQNNLQIDLL